MVTRLQDAEVASLESKTLLIVISSKARNLKRFIGILNKRIIIVIPKERSDEESMNPQVHSRVPQQRMGSCFQDAKIKKQPNFPKKV